MHSSNCLRFLLILMAATWSLGCSKQTTEEDSLAESESVDADSSSRAKRTVMKLGDDDLHPTVELNTTLGKILVKLDAEKAPLTVRNFMAYVERGHYDGTIFHQVEPGYVVLGGGFNASLKEVEGRYTISNEAANGLKNKRGTIAMARDPSIIDSATCQFFINVADNPDLDHQGDNAEAFGYCVFGEVVEGMDVVEKIAASKVKQQDQFERLPEKTVLLESTRRLR